MGDTELLEALDRRAGRAVDALDSRLAGAEPPPLPLETGGRLNPRLLLVAATIAVVAMLGISFAVDDRDDEAGTTADDRDVPVETSGGITRLALTDPGALGYELRAAFDGDTAPAETDPALLDLRWTAHVPEGSTPAEGPIVLTAILPPDMYDIGGELVDIGGSEAVLRVLGPQTQLAWPVESAVRQLSSVHLDPQDLVEVARAASAAGWDGSGALPGHQILHQGPIAEFSRTLPYAGGGPTGREGVAYDRPGDHEDFVIGWSSGTDPQARWDARRTMATETAAFEVRDRPARYHRAGPRSEGELSWLEPDGTLVEVVFFGDPADIIPVLDTGLGSITAAEHDRMVADHPPEAHEVLIDFPDRDLDPTSDAPNVAELLAETPDARTRVAVTSHEVSGLNLVLEGDEGNAGGSAYPLPDLQTPALIRLSLPDPARGFVVGGVVPPGTDVRSVSITDRSTGEQLVVEQVSTGGIPGSDHALFVALVPGASWDVQVDVSFQTPDGERTWRL